MTRPFVMLLDDADWTVEEVVRWADRSPLVSHWRCDMPNCVYLLTDAAAAELSKDFQAAMRRVGRFIFAEVGERVAGRMFPEAWSILADKRPLNAPAGAQKPLRPSA